jgi:hypothetical protein
VNGNEINKEPDSAFIRSMVGVLVVPIMLSSMVVLAADEGILLLALGIFNREDILVSWKWARACVHKA